LLRGQESSTQAPCGFGSVLITKMLTTWGFDGYVRWLRGIKATYRMRRDWLCDLFEEEFDLQHDGANVVALLDGRIKGVTGYAKTQSTKWDEKKAQLGVAGHGKTPLISFVPPTAGMFIFLGIHIGHHPDFSVLQSQGESEPQKVLMERLWRELAEELVCSKLYATLAYMTGSPRTRLLFRRTRRHTS
jgi:aromatic amino acid aminotransferase I